MAVVPVRCQLEPLTGDAGKERLCRTRLSCITDSSALFTTDLQVSEQHVGANVTYESERTDGVCEKWMLQHRVVHGGAVRLNTVLEMSLHRLLGA